MEKYGSVELRDLSAHGCSIELVNRVSVGETLFLKIPGLDQLTGVVCWVNGFTCGVELDPPLHPAVVDALIKRLGN